MKKNVGVLIPSLNGGGAERAAIRIANLLSVEFNIYLIVLDKKYNSYEYDGEIIFIDNFKYKNKVIKNIQRILKIRKIKKELKLTSMISFLDIPNIINILSSYRKCSNLVSIRSFNFHHKNKLIKFIKGILYKRAKKIIAVSRLIEKDFAKEYNIDENKIMTIYNPISSIELKKLADEEAEYPLKHKKDSIFNYIAVGRISYPKGYWHLIKSFSLLVSKGYPVRLIILGKDNTNGKADLLINELKLTGNVFLQGFSKNPFPMIKNSDVFVLTSLYEGFPNGLVEALAIGLPSIATDCESGPKEIFSDNLSIFESVNKTTITDNGILIPKLEEEENWNSEDITKGEIELSKAMEMLYLDQQLREKLSESSKKRVNKFSNENCRKLFSNLINEDLDKR